MPEITTDFWIGLILAVSSSIFIGTSFILKKRGLMELTHRAGNGGFGYLKEWMWWAGLILMGVGEAANFVAYAFAPATLVTPLGALSVLFSAFLASRLLNEHLNILGKLGCFICLLGSTFIVLHAPKEQEITSMAQLAQHLIDPGFLVYVGVVILISMIMILYLSPRYGNTNPLVYVTVTGTIGSLSVMGSKGVGFAFKETIAGRNELDNWLTWFLVICILIFITIQMIYLNKALDVFNTAMVTPMLYVVFTGCVILASGILFKEWSHLSAEDIIGNACGFLTVVSGIFLLQAFKDVQISLPSFSQAVAKETRRSLEETTDLRIVSSMASIRSNGSGNMLNNDQASFDQTASSKLDVDLTNPILTNQPTSTSNIIQSTFEQNKKMDGCASTDLRQNESLLLSFGYSSSNIRNGKPSGSVVLSFFSDLFNRLSDLIQPNQGQGDGAHYGKGYSSRQPKRYMRVDNRDGLEGACRKNLLLNGLNGLAVGEHWVESENSSVGSGGKHRRTKSDNAFSPNGINSYSNNLNAISPLPHSSSYTMKMGGGDNWSNINIASPNDYHSPKKNHDNDNCNNNNNNFKNNNRDGSVSENDYTPLKGSHFESDYGSDNHTFIKQYNNNNTDKCNITNESNHFYSEDDNLNDNNNNNDFINNNENSNSNNNNYKMALNSTIKKFQYQQHHRTNSAT